MELKASWLVPDLRSRIIPELPGEAVRGTRMLNTVGMSRIGSRFAALREPGFDTKEPPAL
jgi:hypothetical protein